MNYYIGAKTLSLKYNSSFVLPIDGADVTQNPDLSRWTRKVPLHMSSLSNNTKIFHTACLYYIQKTICVS